MDGVSLVETRAEGIVIETPRYRSFTALLAQLSEKGATIVEIAGNDDVLLTATAPAAPKARRCIVLRDRATATSGI